MKLDSNEVRLEEQLQKNLRGLFSKSEFKTLKRVIETRGKMKAIEATNKALEAEKYPQYNEAASQILAVAHRYKIALEILLEIESEKEDFVVIK